MKNDGRKHIYSDVERRCQRRQKVIWNVACKRRAGEEGERERVRGRNAGEERIWGRNVGECGEEGE